MITQEGTIEIPLEEFWEWVQKTYADHMNGMETSYGVPRVNKGNDTLEIDFAAADDGHPSQWAEKPKSVKQWEELK